jgi:hypothetical protein
MKLLRTIPWFTRVLVGLFLVAQFAGMASSPRANALPMAAAGTPQSDALHVDAPARHHHHAQSRVDHGTPCGGNPADGCCALHACFSGLLPPVVAIAAVTVAGEPLSVSPDDVAPGAPSGRLDRPPRPLH